MIELFQSDRAKVLTCMLAIAIAGAGLWFGFGIFDENPWVWAVALTWACSALTDIPREATKDARLDSKEASLAMERRLIVGAGLTFLTGVSLGSAVVLALHPASWSKALVVASIAAAIGIGFAGWRWLKSKEWITGYPG